MKTHTLEEYRKYTSAGLATAENDLYLDKWYYEKEGDAEMVALIKVELEKIHQVERERERMKPRRFSGGSGWRVREFSDDFTLDDEFYMDW